MASKQLTAVDIFNSLTPAEKRKALKVLQQAEQTPCQRLGHNFKPAQPVVRGWFAPVQTIYLCVRCGKSIKH